MLESAQVEALRDKIHASKLDNDAIVDLIQNRSKKRTGRAELLDALKDVREKRQISRAIAKMIEEALPGKTQSEQTFPWVWVVVLLFVVLFLYRWWSPDTAAASTNGNSACDCKQASDDEGVSAVVRDFLGRATEKAIAGRWQIVASRERFTAFQRALKAALPCANSVQMSGRRGSWSDELRRAYDGSSCVVLVMDLDTVDEAVAGSLKSLFEVGTVDSVFTVPSKTLFVARSSRIRPEASVPDRVLHMLTKKTLS